MKAPRNISPALAEEILNSAGMEKLPVASLYSALRIVPACPTALESWSTRIISTTEGGMICPKVPDAQIAPLARDGE